jgi:Ca-activated chloride channel family protein
VTYAGSTGVALEPTSVSDSETIVNAIDAFVSGGGTAGSAGLDLAYQQAADGFIEGGTNHVVLCTDGDFNVGPSSTEELLAQIEEKRRSGVTLTALGFGTQGVNDSMLETVSNAGNGMYGVISDPTQAERYVEERLLQNLTFIAKDMKIQVEFNAEHVEAYRLLGYENRAIADEDFRDDVVDAGEVGAGHRVTALYELVLAGDPLPDMAGAPAIETGDAFSGEVEVDPESLVLVKVRYKDVEASEQDVAYETSAQLAPSNVATSVDDLDDDFQWAVSVAAFAEVLKGSPYGDAANLGGIGKVVERQRTRDEDRAEFAELFGAARELLEPRAR